MIQIFCDPILISSRNVDPHTVIGRSPILYVLLSIKNKERFDQIFPPFVRDNELKIIFTNFHNKCVITDFTEKKLFKTEKRKLNSATNNDVSEGLMYGKKQKQIENWIGFKNINRRIVFKNQFYGLAC